MEYVALECFHMLQEEPQFLCLGRGANAEGIFDGAYACQSMSDGADTAYPSAYPWRVFPALANEQGLEESRCFNNLPFCLLKPAVLYFNTDIPVAFYARQVMDVDSSGYFHLSSFIISGFF